MSRQPVRRRLLEADEGQSEDNAVQQTHADIAFSSDGKCNDGECDRERNPASSGQFDGSERVCELSEDGHSNGEFSEDECSNDEFSDDGCSIGELSEDGCSNGEPSEVGCSDSELGGDALSDGKLSGGVLSDGDLSDNELVAAADVAQGEWYVLVKAPSRMTKVEGLAAAAVVRMERDAQEQSHIPLPVVFNPQDHFCYCQRVCGWAMFSLMQCLWADMARALAAEEARGAQNPTRRHVRPGDLRARRRILALQRLSQDQKKLSCILLMLPGMRATPHFPSLLYYRYSCGKMWPL